MLKLLATIFAVAAAAVALLAAVTEAGNDLNHNATLLRDETVKLLLTVIALAGALVAALSAISEAGLNMNDNETLLRS